MRTIELIANTVLSTPTNSTRTGFIMSPIQRSLDLQVSLLTSTNPAVWIFQLAKLADQLQEGQVQPFYLDTSDNERLFCWHVLPLDVYLQNEEQLAMGTTTGEIVDELKGTMGEKLLRADPESRVVVNFHGVSLPVCVVSSATWEGLRSSTHVYVHANDHYALPPFQD
jgi:hypothetical protein